MTLKEFLQNHMNIKPHKAIKRLAWFEVEGEQQARTLLDSYFISRSKKQWGMKDEYQNIIFSKPCDSEAQGKNLCNLHWADSLEPFLKDE